MSVHTTTASAVRSRSYGPFYLRAFVSMMMISLLLLLLVSGAALFVSPPGQLSNTMAWRLAGLSKGQWEALHIVFGFLWVPLALVHLVFNRRVITGFVRDRVSKAFVWRREVVAAVAVTLFLAVASVFDLPPAAQLMEWEESFGAFWAERAPEITVAPSASAALDDPGLPLGSGLGLGRYATVDPETGALRPVGKEAAGRYEASIEAAVEAALAAAGVERTASDGVDGASGDPGADGSDSR